MTRKEPQFNDDMNVPTSMSELRETVDPNIKTSSSVLVSGSNSAPARSQWLLWLFVSVSFCVSFGTAFFGLEEAGRYKAALDKAERQAVELEATITRLNKVQAQGIGELAQSDAQMRKMMTNVENKLITEFSTEIQSTSKRLDVFSSSMSSFNIDLTELSIQIENMQTLQESLKEQLDLSRNQLVSERSRLDNALKNLGVHTTNIESLVKTGRQLDERIIIITGDLKRTEALADQALEDKSALLATEVLAEEILALQTDTRSYQLETEKLKKADVRTTASIDVISDQLKSVPTTQARLKDITKTLGQFEVGRLQLAQRIVDFDERWNLVNELQRTISDLEKRQDNAKLKVETSSREFSELKEEIKKLQTLDQSQ